jgi:hypothetical protein
MSRWLSKFEALDQMSLVTMTPREDPMGATFSAINIETRLEIRDLLSRFCHSLDRNMTQQWNELFTFDAIVDAPKLGRFVGIEEIGEILGLVQQKGCGAWRHFLHNVYIDLTEDSRDLLVAAYCTVSDWRTQGNVVRCWDLNARITKRRGWKIAALSLTPVCTDAPAPPQTAMEAASN